MKKAFSLLLSVMLCFSALSSLAEAPSGLPTAKSYTDPVYEEVVFRNSLDLSDAGKNESNPRGLMAHNIYNDPVLTGTSGGFTGFSIDFQADYAGTGTYWALCNWSMDLSATRKAGHTVSDEGGAYCGLQVTPQGPKAIMSFWDMIIDQKTVTPNLVYPVVNGNDRFGGEGTGARYLTDYAWKPGQWYRMYISCWDDATGETYVDMWVMEMRSGEWTHICTYDTQLKHSFFTGGMSQFMENYHDSYATQVRSFQYANIYVRDRKSGKWVYLTDHRMSVDTWWDNKKGTYAFGSTSSTLWGVTLGYGPDAAVRYSDVSAVKHITAK